MSAIETRFFSLILQYSRLSPIQIPTAVSKFVRYPYTITRSLAAAERVLSIIKKKIHYKYAHIRRACRGEVNFYLRPRVRVLYRRGQPSLVKLHAERVPGTSQKLSPTVAIHASNITTLISSAITINSQGHQLFSPSGGGFPRVDCELNDVT